MSVPAVAHAYVDSCILLSLFLGDSGYPAAEQWLLNQGKTPLWISHWMLLEFAGVVALCVRRGDLTAERAATIHSEFECFRQERLQLLEPRGIDFLQARQWLQQGQSQARLRSGDALHLAIAKREGLTLTTADKALIDAAEVLGLPHKWVA
ncbi:type II toxin-antitoxin system VapC family toxin [Cyanobium sp. FACHB-13342]|uniref:type II toxin-antitoxin system VapC family toxin n=1 Tax=Cyanobium sp. FACHB-13342 TaxID=2692793 RepID=UPI0016802287|nr:type II toxin-antitoxin system VapC family toxin [Cyanobium sp. FACHB-13342]MBD2422759.1 type II toxin-antitoxin system VapC family toxin [Cyanobium sp. FACHB-13342]